jgi:hypothetical protein
MNHYAVLLLLKDEVATTLMFCRYSGKSLLKFLAVSTIVPDVESN